MLFTMAGANKCRLVAALKVFSASIVISSIFVMFYLKTKNLRSLLCSITILTAVCTLFSTFVFISRVTQKENNISPHIQIIDFNEKLTTTKFQCITTKTLLGNVSTKICLHDSKRDIYVSGAFQERRAIWEEKEVTHLLRFFRRHDNLHFIDIGAHIGTYTMFVAALGRTVFSIDCFRPNLIRLRHALQLTHMTNRVVLVNNALHSQSGQILKLAIQTKNIGGQGLYVMKNRSNRSFITKPMSTNHSYLVKTIRFDDLLPMLISRGIQRTIIKMDIEGSEHFVVESGEQIFKQLHVPLVQMEWLRIRDYPERVQTIFQFFMKHNYIPMTDQCERLNLEKHRQWPKDVYWFDRHFSDFCSSVG